MIFQLLFGNPNHKNLYFILPILFFWLILLSFNKKSFLSFFSKILFFLKDCFKFYWLSAIFLIVLLCYGFYLPLSYDESYTFIQFVNRSIFYATCTYPVPNNHVLHSIFSNISWHILGWTNLALIVRIPSILASYLLMNIFITKISKNNLFYSGLFLILLLFNFPYLAFSFQARGYSFQILIAVITLVIIFKSSNIKTFKDKNNLILFFSTLGLYTSPAYLYTFLPLYSLFLIINKNFCLESVKYILKSGVFFTLTVILLYAPIMIFRGYESIIHNRYVAPLDHLSIHEAFNHITISFTEVLGGKIISLLVLLLVVFYTIVKRRFVILVLFLIPIILMLVLKQTPFSRVFLPLAIVVVVLAIADLKDGFKNTKQLNPMIYILFIGVSIAISTFLFFENPNGGLETSYRVKYLSKHFDNRDVYLTPNTHDYLKTPIEAYLQVNEINYTLLNKDTKLKEGSILIYSEKNIENIKILDSVPSLNKKVYVGKVVF